MNLLQGNLLRPNMRTGKMTDLYPEQLTEIGCKALLLDIDNTMTTHNNPEPAEGVTDWIERIRTAGFEMAIVSNNTDARVALFAGKLKLDFVDNARKPLSTGFRRACERLSLEPNEVAVVGDQIFTDVLGGNLFGAYTILTEPYELESAVGFRIKRAAERIIMKRWK